MRLALLVALLLAACGAPTPDGGIPTEAPYIRGTVTALDDQEVRIEEPAGAGSSAQAVLRLRRSTRVIWRTGEPATLGDLRLGSRVSAWVSGPVAESFPVRADADVLLIETTTPPNEIRL